MPVREFRKKPVVIEAIQFDGSFAPDLAEFVGVHGWYTDVAAPAWVIHTRHGSVRAEIGDWIIKGEFGDYWPCKPDIFEQTYEAIDG